MASAPRHRNSSTYYFSIFFVIVNAKYSSFSTNYSTILFLKAQKAKIMKKQTSKDVHQKAERASGFFFPSVPQAAFQRTRVRRKANTKTRHFHKIFVKNTKNAQILLHSLPSCGIMNTNVVFCRACRKATKKQEETYGQVLQDFRAWLDR